MSVVAFAEEAAGLTKIPAPCPAFGACGGCSLQDLAYPDQLLVKRRRLDRALEVLGSVPAFGLTGLDDPWRYRNKAEFTFGSSGGRLTLGYHAARSYWRTVDLEDCLLLPERAMKAVRGLRALAEATGLPAYHPRTHQGFFRHAVIRHSAANNRMMLSVFTASRAPDGADPRARLEEIAERLMAEHPDVSGVSWGGTDRIADTAEAETLVLLRGEAHLEDRLGPFTLRLLPGSFLQPNSRLAHRMYETLQAWVGERRPHTAWDLYCGVGPVSFYLSRGVKKVYAIEVEPRHLDLARVNARLNGITNVEFREGRVEELLADRRFWLQDARPDVIVVDPPRAGLHERALSSLLAARPEALAYISCNAQTLTRDLAVLTSSFPRYRLARLQAFDLFPHTNHLEVLTLLERR